MKSAFKKLIVGKWAKFGLKMSFLKLYLMCNQYFQKHLNWFLLWGKFRQFRQIWPKTLFLASILPPYPISFWLHFLCKWQSIMKPVFNDWVNETNFDQKWYPLVALFPWVTILIELNAYRSFESKLQLFCEHNGGKWERLILRLHAYFYF